MTHAAGALQLVVTGVAGTGKSTVGERLADALGADLIEGDAHHSPSDVERMTSGQPLTDEDRRPWLETLARLLAAERAQGRSAVLACSALRRSYRDILRGDLPTQEVFFVHLHADFEVLDRRMRARAHFMPPSLLRSQLDTLEPLDADEAGVAVDAALPVEEVVKQVRAALAQWRGIRP